MKITKRWLKSKSACIEGIDWVVKNANGLDGIDVVKALIDDNKLDWANWLIVRIMTREQYVSYAVFSAEQVLNIYEARYPDDKRPRNAINAAKAVLIEDDLNNRAAAATAAYAAYDAAYAAAYAAAAAYDAAYAAAAAYDAAYAAATAAYAAYDAAYAAAYAAADRKSMQLKILNYGLSIMEGKKCESKNKQ